MWTLQEKTGDKHGAWWWLQFGLRPWEAKDSEYYGAALAALAVGIAPENYRSSPEIQNDLRLLREYLDRCYEKQSLCHRVVLLWASTKLPGLIDFDRQESLIKEILNEQSGDGEWLGLVRFTTGGHASRKCPAGAWAILAAAESKQNGRPMACIFSEQKAQSVFQYC